MSSAATSTTPSCAPDRRHSLLQQRRLGCNSGDWVESCTALVEHFDGRLELINWIDQWALDPLTGRITVPDDSDAEAPALVDADS